MYQNIQKYVKIDQSIMMIKIKTLQIWLKCDPCVSIYYGFDITYSTYTSRQYSGWIIRFRWLFNHFYYVLLYVMHQNIQKYIKINQSIMMIKIKNVTNMIKVWCMCVHYGFNITSSILLDRIQYIIILYCFTNIIRSK